jgi:hypothetical protein
VDLLVRRQPLPFLMFVGAALWERQIHQDLTRG